LPEEDAALSGSEFPIEIRFRGFNDQLGDAALHPEFMEVERALSGLELELVRPPLSIAGDGRKSTYLLADDMLPDKLCGSLIQFKVRTYSTSPPLSYYMPPSWIGVLAGSIYGPEGLALYVILEEAAGVRSLRIVGPPNGSGVRKPDLPLAASSWEVDQPLTFLFVWNPLTRRVRVFSDQPGSWQDPHDTELADFEFGEIGHFLPGIEIFGRRFDRANKYMQIGSVFALDGGSPTDQVTLTRFGASNFGDRALIQGVPSGGYPTQLLANNLVSLFPVDPLEEESSPWLRPRPDSYPTFGGLLDPGGNPYPTGEIGVTDQLALEKMEVDQINFFFRTELSLGAVAQTSLILEADFFALSTYHPASHVTGMGFRLNLADVRLDLFLLDNFAQPNLGLYKKTGYVHHEDSYEKPATAIDWTSPVRIRLVLEALREKASLWVVGEAAPRLEIPYTAAQLPPAISDWPACLTFGHLCRPLWNTKGSLLLSRLAYLINLAAYEARGGALPPASLPVWPQHVPVGPGANTLESGRLVIKDMGFGGSPGVQVFQKSLVHVVTALGGLTTDFRVQIGEWAGQTGITRQALDVVPVGVVLCNGEKCLHVMFVDAGPAGKFVYLPRADLEDSTKAVIRQSSSGKAISAQVDFPEEHEFRVVWRPGRPLQLYVDDMATPVVEIPWGSPVDLPSHYLFAPAEAITPSVSFGSLDAYRKTVSYWRWVRVAESDGYDVSLTPQFASDQLEYIYNAAMQPLVEYDTL